MTKIAKIKVGIIGTGNLGTDLLMKIQRSNVLECGVFAGVNRKSQNIKMAKKMGVNISFDSIDVIVSNPNLCEVIFDATSAYIHTKNLETYKKLNKFIINLTPTKDGKMCIPYLNLKESLKTKNVSMITCGGQATIPIIRSIMEVHPLTKYIEVVASISSKSAGIATRNNIDEYTQTTSDAIKFFTKVPKAKAIIILNPAEPPILMHNTIYAELKNPNIKKLTQRIKNVERNIKKYVPGYSITLGPIFENDRLIVMNEVMGRGDFLPTYAGNLDIINNAAISVAEAYANKMMTRKKTVIKNIDKGFLNTQLIYPNP